MYGIPQAAPIHADARPITIDGNANLLTNSRFVDS